MNIIQVYQTNPFEVGQGGGVRYVKNLLKGLKIHCDEILFIGIGEIKTQNENIILYPITKKLTGYISFLFRLILKLPFMDLSKYDVVHVHRLYFAIPFIILKPRLKIVCSLHGRTFSVFESNYGNKALILVQFIFKIIEKFCIKRIDYLVPVSKDVLNNFKIKYKNFEDNSIEIIGSMLNLSAFKVSQSSYLQKKYGNNKYVLFIGRLSDVKNIDFLIDLWSTKFQNKDKIKLVIVGQGEDDIKLQNYATLICKANKIFFLGELSPVILPQVISSSNLTVLCSKHEASPTVIKESLSCGIPVVSNLVGDVDEFIISGLNGFVVNKEIENFYDAIINLIDSPISKNDVILNSKSALEKCSFEYVSNQYFKIYKKITK